MERICRRISAHGADIVQLRDKTSSSESILKDARAISGILSNTRTLFIVNDRLDIARMVDCDGVHLGQGDTSVGTARAILGEDKIIGVSCHSVAQAIRAQKEGADYIGIGPVFKTPTKPRARPVGTGLIKEVSRRIRIPFFAIGGLNRSTINPVLSSGARRVAVCSAVCRAPDTRSAAAELSGLLRRVK